MQTRTLTIDAGGSVRDTQGGGYLGVQSVSNSHSIDIAWLDSSGTERAQVDDVHAGQTFQGAFAGYVIFGTPGDVVVLLVGALGEYADPITSAAPVTVTGTVTTAESLITALTNAAPVAASAVIAPLVAASATRRVFWARNVGAEAVALVGAAGTYANAAIYIQPGETHVERVAPGAAWYVICDAALATTVNLLTGV